MDPDEERPTSPVSSLLANEVPSPRSDRSRSENGLLKSVSGIGAEMIYSNLNYFIPVKGQKEGKQIIKNCNGFMGPGVNAILGPTGSGKTTLLGMLAGRTNDAWMEGDIFVNGEPRKKSFRLQCGFVVQDDVVMGTLTVRENLAFSAALRLSSEYSDSDRKARVEQIIQDLGLSQCADTRVGTDERRGISGGERRRTSIGMELIISPDVLFLDEPTTGLDATTACTVVKLLQRQARRGRTVIFSIHQPRYSIFKLFDTLTLLSNGETIYHGPCGESVQYFAAIGYQCETYNNPADYYMDVIMNHETIMRKGTGQEEEEDKTVRETIYDSTAETNKTLAELYLDSDYYSETCLKIQPVVDSVEDRERVLYKESTRNVDYQSSFCRQMNFVGKRVVKNLFRDPRAFFSQLIVKLVYALIIGGLFFQLKTNEYGLSNRNGVLFFVITDAVFSNLNAIAVFMDERRIFRHEIANGYYRVSSYFLSKVIFDILPMRLVPLLIFSSIMYFMVGLQDEVTKFFIFALILFLTSLCSVSICLLVSSSVELLAVANLTVSVPFVLMLLFSGFLIRIGDLPVWLRWLQYLSVFRYGLAGLQLNELEDMTFTGCIVLNSTSCISGNQYLSQQSLHYPWDIWQSAIALAGISVVLLLFTYVQLRRRRKIT